MIDNSSTSDATIKERDHRATDQKFLNHWLDKHDWELHSWRAHGQTWVALAPSAADAPSAAFTFELMGHRLHSSALSDALLDQPVNVQEIDLVVVIDVQVTEVTVQRLDRRRLPGCEESR